MTSVVVFDYGFGNVRSMVRALANLDVDVTLTSDYRQAIDADGLVVPGVGAFAACVEGLKTVGGDRVVYERLTAGKPVLGVCVGLQVMFAQGTEGGITADGLGLLGGVVEKLDADVVPHMGWNTVEAATGTRLLKGLEHERFYFVHSYGVTAPVDDAPKASILAGSPKNITWCEYGRSRFVAAAEQGPLSVTQFHPEKSAEAGAQLLRNWIATF